MNKTKSVTIGFVAGGFVATLSIMLIFCAWGAIEHQTLTAGYSGDGGMVEWMIRWVAIALAVGSISAFVFPYVSEKLRWSNGRYLILSLLLMFGLDLLTYLPIYDSSVHIYPAVYLVLNAIFCIGFGVLIPGLSDARSSGRLAL